MPPHPTSSRSILILFSHLRLGLLRLLFPQVSPPKYCIRLSYLSHVLYAPPIFILLDLFTRKILCEQYRSLSSSLSSFFHSLVTSSLLGPNILLKTLFSKIINLRSSLNVTDHVSHPYKIRGKIIILYILVLKFLDSKLESKDSAPN